ncbi:MAG: MucR family transcriptional regulator [Sneathiellaceae bacterium]
MTETSSKAADTGQLLDFTTQIVTAFVRQNSLTADALPQVIDEVYKALKGVAAGPAAPEAAAAPAVPVRKSVTPDYLVCLEDGRKLKMLKRHLRTRYDMTPEDYRKKWNLPADYPMVAPNYAASRSDLARQIGLGRTPKAKAAAKAPAKRRTRKKAV